MIDEIAGEKKRGGNERGDHAGDMLRQCPRRMKIPADRDKNRADEIERSVDRRQIGDCHALL